MAWAEVSPPPEGGGDLLERGGEGDEALVLPPLQQRLGGLHEGLGRDEDVVGLVLRVAQGGRERATRRAARAAPRRRRGGRACRPRRSIWTEPGSGGERGEPPRGGGVGDVEGPGGVPGDLDGAGDVPGGVEASRDEARRAGVGDLDAVEKDERADAGVAVVRDGEGVVALEEDAGGDGGLEDVGPLALEATSPRARAVEGEAEVVLAGARRSRSRPGGGRGPGPPGRRRGPRPRARRWWPSSARP